MKKKQEIVLRMNDMEQFGKYMFPEYNKIVGKDYIYKNKYSCECI
jgi:hypothetical protein